MRRNKIMTKLQSLGSWSNGGPVSREVESRKNQKGLSLGGWVAGSTVAQLPGR